MAKDKSLKSRENLPKKKKSDSSVAEVNAEKNMAAGVKKKRKKMEVEEAPVEIPPEAIAADEKKQRKKAKKHKKKQEAEAQTKTTEIMARDKSLNSGANLAKKKKSDSSVAEVHAENIMAAGVKKKRKKMEVEEAPVEIPPEAIAADEKKQRKKAKKHKKKQEAEAQTKTTEISDPAEATRELEGEEDLSPEEKRVLERKMKKILKKEEKKRLKAEGETQKKTEAAGPTAPQQALDYLTCWAENRTEWKFQKTRQTWLLQNMFDSEKIPDENFSVLLQYLDGLRGLARDTSVQKALVLVEESGKAPEDAAVQQRAHRAREVIQLLS